MSFFATEQENYKLWDYLQGNFHQDTDVSLRRYWRLWELNELSKNELQLSCKDPDSQSWLPWKGFYQSYTMPEYLTAIDMHRSLLENEVLIESDYEDYEQNYRAAKAIGAILEEKGFAPLYYFSGNKSIHIHLFFDFKAFLSLSLLQQEEIMHLFLTEGIFKKKFIEWLRAKCVSCWDLKLYKFDTNLVKSKHLIRCELSRNKRGFKTFLGYTHQDLSPIPQIVNEENKLLPVLGELRMSKPTNMQGVVDEFLQQYLHKAKKVKSASNAYLGSWLPPTDRQATLRSCIQFMLSDGFLAAGDGHQRAMFILINELSKLYDETTTLHMVRDWNVRIGMKIQDLDILYRVRQSKKYVLTCQYIHEFLQELGLFDEQKIRCARFK